MHTKRELVALLRGPGLHLSKRLGQHYLIDPNLTRRVVDACEIGADQTVVEIGAGLGALTDLLAERAGRVIALEVDRGVAALLADRLAGLSNVEVRCEDALAFDWESARGCIVVGAIPYHITSHILVTLAERSGLIASAWLGMQREVAQRLAASPGTKAYGRLSVLMQYRFEVELVLRMPRQAFFPVPSVDSMWVALRPRPSPAVVVADEARFFALVRAAFEQRRKTLLNTLTHVMDPPLTRPAAEAALAAARIDHKTRGETLTLEDFARLTDCLR
jgi:16S rRNA (adenine1518-N6/adenine1519-N6)-dimethyltransferase